MFRVHYIHGAGYWVSRSFDTREAAEEFISNNALVCPLPGPPYITGPGNDPDGMGSHVTEDTTDHYPTTENAPGF